MNKPSIEEAVRLSIRTPFRRSAKLSPDGLYRTRLRRSSDYAGTMTFIMLNPSVGNAERDDPTLRRCLGFMVREGLGNLNVINLFTRISPTPRALWQGDDPLGSDAATEIRDAIAKSYPEAYVNEIRRDAEKGSGWDELPYDRIVCAWGAAPSGMPDWFRIMRQEQIDEVIDYARAMKRELFCLGKTDSGDPRHPLYAKADAPLIRFAA